MDFPTDPREDERVLHRVLDAYRKRFERDKERHVRFLGERIMHSRITKPAIAAVVLLAALAVGVERLTRVASDKTYAYSAEIRTNMALDLDPAGAIPLREAQSEDFDVTWSNESGGSLKILPGASTRIWAIGLIDPGWDDVVGWAISHLAEIQASTATSIAPTQKTPFVAVLTSDGNLAVVQIHRRDAEMAWLDWRVEKAVSPGYGPVQIVTLQSVDREGGASQPCAIDLDTGRTVAIPAEVLRMPAEEWMGWLEENGIDAIARMSDEGDGLVGAGLCFWTWMASEWAGANPVNLREEMTRASYQPRRPLLFQRNRYQHVFPFKTREGGIGMLQILAVDTARQTIQFRYRLLQDEAGDTPVDNDLESERHAQSVRRLMRFGLLACIYADHHDGKYPASIEELKDLAQREQQDFQWILDNVEYVGAGKSAYDPNASSTALAYDKVLIQEGKGTYAVFRDSHAEFVEPNRLAAVGLPAKAKE